ncbi:MAG: DUF3306 domain-containing protein [Betaproteobacteria bacterium]|nr:DUF3306 domain-containing protein [Betaproteobacteria bacterium]
MAADDNFLSRWSRRKTEARTSPEDSPAKPTQAPATLPAGGAVSSGATVPGDETPLPPVESLTPESDFAPFMAPDVDGNVRRQALKTLFGDPRFNVMDMMDVYVDDYSKPDPLPESWLARMDSVSWLGDKAGRDREEEEKRRALEEAQAGALIADQRIDIPADPVIAPDQADALPPADGEKAEASPISPRNMRESEP